MKVLFSGTEQHWAEWEQPLRAALAERGVPPQGLAKAWPTDAVDAIIYAPVSGSEDGIDDFSQFPNLRLVQSIWAGVESVATNPSLTAPLARMVDPGLTQGMVEYCLGHAMRYHLAVDHWANSQDGVWSPMVGPLAWDRRVTVLGLGALGHAVAEAAKGVGFAVSGWSRRPKTAAGIACHHGEDGLKAVLEQTDILILLLPLTAETTHLLNAERLAWLPDGACVINAGRGPLIDDQAFLAALDAGKIAHATLDVFAQEPLPPSHPYWDHPHVTVTPHIASITRPETAAPVVAENLRRLQAGEVLHYLVDREAGY